MNLQITDTIKINFNKVEGKKNSGIEMQEKRIKGQKSNKATSSGIKERREKPKNFENNNVFKLPNESPSKVRIERQKRVNFSTENVTCDTFISLDDEVATIMNTEISRSYDESTVDESRNKVHQSARSDTSSVSTTSSRSSGDSSYYTDNASIRNDTLFPKPKHNSYDRKKQQKIKQATPKDLVRKVMKLESEVIAALSSQKTNSSRRQDALWEGVERDYQSLAKSIDRFSRERKLKANQSSRTEREKAFPPPRNDESLVKHQKKMDQAFENILRCIKEPVISTTPRDYIHSVNASPLHIDRSLERENEISSKNGCNDSVRKKVISEMMMKIEIFKQKLIQDYQADLSNDAYDVSKASPRASRNRKKLDENVSKSASNKVQATRRCEEISSTNENICHQPTTKDSRTHAKNKQYQVRPDSNKVTDKKRSQPLEPIIQIVTAQNAENSGNIRSRRNSSVATDVTGNQRESLLEMLKDVSPIKRCSPALDPVKFSFDQKRGGSYEVVIDSHKREITFLKKKKKIPISMPKNT